MISNKIPIIVCGCFACSVYGMSPEPSSSANLERPSVSNVLLHPGTRQSFDSLSPEMKSMIFEAIDRVTFTNRERSSEVMTKGVIVGDIKDSISEAVVSDCETTIYFPSVSAYYLTVGVDAVAEFRSFRVNSMTITSFGRGDYEVSLNKDDGQPEAKKIRESESESYF